MDPASLIANALGQIIQLTPEQIKDAQALFSPAKISEVFENVMGAKELLEYLSTQILAMETQLGVVQTGTNTSIAELTTEIAKLTAEVEALKASK